MNAERSKAYLLCGAAYNASRVLVIVEAFVRSSFRLSFRLTACLSVCLSHSAALSKQRKLRSQNLHCWLLQGL